MIIRGVGAIVSGGASGLGGAAAARLAAGGAKVTIFDLNDELGQAHAKAIGATFVKVNVCDEASVKAAIDEAAAHGDPARILVNCAGIARAKRTVGKTFEAHDLDLFRQTIEINLIGTFNLLSKFSARLARAELVGEERGVIVNTASIAAFDGQIGQIAYAASKGGVVGMTLPAARDLAPLAIRVMTIAPGLFLTPILAVLPQDELDTIGRQSPFPQRTGAPEEFAQLVESIIANPMLNGETIRLDGAMRMPPRFG